LVRDQNIYFLKYKSKYFILLEEKNDGKNASVNCKGTFNKPPVCNLPVQNSTNTLPTPTNSFFSNQTDRPMGEQHFFIIIWEFEFYSY